MFYPVAVLPGWLQPLAWALPPTYVDEGLRAALNDGVVRTDLMAVALAINAGLFAAATLAFLWFLRASRAAGTLLQMGE